MSFGQDVNVPLMILQKMQAAAMVDGV